MSDRFRFFAVVLVVAAVAGCRIEVSSGDDVDIPSGESAFHRATPSQNGIVNLSITSRDSNGVETATFAPGEQITLEYSVTNLTNRHQRLNLPDSGYPWSCIRPEEGCNRPRGCRDPIAD